MAAPGDADLLTSVVISGVNVAVGTGASVVVVAGASDVVASVVAGASVPAGVSLNNKTTIMKTILTLTGKQSQTCQVSSQQ